MENENMENQEMEINEEGIKPKCNKEKKYNNKSMHASGGAVYGLGFIGAVVYFYQQLVAFGLVY